MTLTRYETNRIEELLARIAADQRKAAEKGTAGIRFRQLVHTLRPRVFITEAGGQFTLEDLALGEGAWNKCFLDGMYVPPKNSYAGEGNRNGSHRKFRAVIRIPKVQADWFYQYLGRFSRLAMNGLADHPNIVTMYEYGSDGQGIPYQILAREPADLFQVLSERRRNAEIEYEVKTDPNVVPDPKITWPPTYFSTTEILRKMRDLLGSAQALEREGFLQIDWKPENILVGEDGRLIATDLDFLCALDADVEAVEYIARVGTPEYRAPETHSMRWYDVRSSVYQIGLMFHSLMTLSMAISRSQINPDDGTLAKAFAPAEEWLGKWYPQWVGSVIKATAWAPQDRYQTFREFREGVEEGYRDAVHQQTIATTTAGGR